jgi:hypothetical protein
LKTGSEPRRESVEVTIFLSAQSILVSLPTMHSLADGFKQSLEFKFINKNLLIKLNVYIKI